MQLKNFQNIHSSCRLTGGVQLYHDLLLINRGKDHLGGFIVKLVTDSSTPCRSCPTNSKDDVIQRRGQSLVQLVSAFIASIRQLQLRFGRLFCSATMDSLFNFVNDIFYVNLMVNKPYFNGVTLC